MVVVVVVVAVVVVVVVVAGDGGAIVVVVVIIGGDVVVVAVGAVKFVLSSVGAADPLPSPCKAEELPPVSSRNVSQTAAPATANTRTTAAPCRARLRTDAYGDTPVTELHAFAHEGNGPPCLLIHGFLSSRSHWLGNVEGLKEVCSPVVVELYGHGRSPSPTDPDVYKPQSYAEQFEEIRESLGVKRWLVCGHSLGAALTLRYTHIYPDCVIAQVFTNSQSALADEVWQTDIPRQAKAGAERLRNCGRAELDANPFHPKNGTRMRSDIRAGLLDDYELHNPAGVANTLEFTVPGSSMRGLVHENTVPSLLTVGVLEDSFAEPRAFAEAAMPHLTVAEFAGGHNVNGHAPAEWTSAVVEFFRTFPPDG